MIPLGLGLIACRSGPPHPTPPQSANVLLITLDTTRADHVGAYGYFRDTTPHLDALALRSVVFDAAEAPMATTLPSHTSMLTGLWPLEHGVRSNLGQGGQLTLSPAGAVPLPELFASAGYNTAAFTSATPLKAGTGIDRGFATFDDPGDKNVRGAAATTEAAISWLRANGPNPFFVWVHYFDPHGPFRPPDAHMAPFLDPVGLDDWLDERGIQALAERPGGAPLEPRDAASGYDGEIHFMDSQINRLLRMVERRKWGEHTVVVVAGDHGEGLGQHGLAGHGHVWHEQVHVPFLVSAPWLPPRRFEAPVSLVDLGPTLLAVMDVPGEAAWLAQASGRDGRAPGGTGPALALSSLRQANLGTPAQVSLRVGSWRWISLGTEVRLHDLRTDPHELRDLAAVLPLHALVLSNLAAQAMAEQEARGKTLGAGRTRAIPDDDIEALRALGYVD